MFEPGGTPIKSLTLADLKPAPYNPREISSLALEGLQYSLTEFGDISGIVWNRRSGHVVCGHQRLKALRQEYGDKLAMQDHAIVCPDGKTFPVREVDWDETQERLANLAANNPLIAGMFTPSARTMIEQLDKIAPVQVEALQLGNLLEELPWPEREFPGDPEAVPEAPEEPVTKPGDVWLLGAHRLMCGDSTLAQDVEKLMVGKKARCMLADPPYGVDYGGHDNPRWSQGHQPIANDSLSEGKQAEFWKTAFALCARYLKGDWYVFAPSGPLNTILAQSLEKAGLKQHQWLIWAKDRFVLGRSHYHYRHEHIAYGWAEQTSWCDRRDADSVLECKRPVASTEHPTMKPVALLTRLLANSTNRDDLVIDPFSGSGQTILAAEQLGRRCYAMEIEPRYCDVAVRRWEQFTGQKAVRE